MAIKINSPKGTPEDEVMFVLERPTTERIKISKKDVEKEITALTQEIQNKSDRLLELQGIKQEMESELDKFKK